MKGTNVKNANKSENVGGTSEITRTKSKELEDFKKMKNFEESQKLKITRDLKRFTILTKTLVAAKFIFFS